MLMKRFICTHCGHHFEAKPAETVICPNCYWSTSVKKEGEEKLAQTEEKPLPESAPEPERSWFGVGVFLAVALLAGVSFLVFRHLQKQDELLETIQSKNARVIATQAPELTLSPEEKEILGRKISLRPDRELTPIEKEILSLRFPFRSRGPLGIPTPPWSEKEFETFLKGEEAHYKIPLEWSYERKLKRLFKAHYLAGTAAFETKNYLQARDEWIRALTFPVYRNDVKKHRGVVLTMLRPYVNDTLSKIGAMNASLVGQELYATEEKISQAYLVLSDLLQKKSWEEASAQLLEIQKQVETVEKLPKAAAPPALPKEVALIDAGIREVLLTQVVPAEPTLPDWDTLRGDLQGKERVIQGRLPSTLEAIQKGYDEALLLIESKHWKEAKSRLETIEFPPELAEDARAKITILNKLSGEEGAGEAAAS
jgi:hypothetical protein